MRSPHSFHIPVMGTGFSIDTPLKVARYGISSAISLVDDILIEQVRKYHCNRLNLPFEAVSNQNPNARAERITAYLNLLDSLVAEQSAALQASPFEPKSDITRYFEMLPQSTLKSEYQHMLTETEPSERVRKQNQLRTQAVPGTIDVNIMTKVDRDLYIDGVRLEPKFGFAMSALRGFALSTLDSSIIFSAGINRRLFGYLEQFEDFFPDESGSMRKRITLKVSDFRSAMIQGKYLARRGMWVSEYRIESGLNCGGHAFVNEAHLLGPILQEFEDRKQELIEQLHDTYTRALTTRKRPTTDSPHDVRITVQGGIGTAAEDAFLRERFGVDGTGWGTPFLLVPEATNVDQEHLDKLAQAGSHDVYLSPRSPLGVPFWSLRTSASEETHRDRILADRPGSPCPKGFVAIDTEFSSVPICIASRAYQKRALAHLDQQGPSNGDRPDKREAVMAKSCICHDLAGCATLRYGIDPAARPAVCCGPNISSFDRVSTLEDMISHIYGRLSLLSEGERPHMFIRELSLYIEYLQEELRKVAEGIIDRAAESFLEFKQGLVSAVEYYRGLAEQLSLDCRERFLTDLEALGLEIESALPQPIPAQVSQRNY